MPAQLLRQDNLNNTLLLESVRECIPTVPFSLQLLATYFPAVYQHTSEPPEPIQFTQLTQNEPQNKTRKFWSKYQ